MMIKFIIDVSIGVAMLAAGVLSFVYPESLPNNVVLIGGLLIIGAINQLSLIMLRQFKVLVNQAYPSAVVEAGTELAKLFTAIKEIEDQLLDKNITPTKHLVEAELAKRDINMKMFEIGEVTTIEGGDNHDDILKRMMEKTKSEGGVVVNFSDYKDDDSNGTRH